MSRLTGCGSASACGDKLRVGGNKKTNLTAVMAGLVPAIHDLPQIEQPEKSWITATRAVMTGERVVF
jgi:hypothetical protein